MQILSAGERKEFTLTNRKISGFTLNAKLKHTTADLTCTCQDIDFSKSLLKVILKRDKQQFVIIQDDLKSLGLESNLFTFARRSFYTDHAWALLFKAEAGTPRESLIPFDIDFGGTIDLTGDDHLLIELDIKTEMFSVNVDTSQSFIEIKEVQSMGFEKYVPYIRSYGITAGERRRTFDLGNNIMSIVMLSYGKTLLLNPVVSSITLSSKTYDETYSYLDLINQRYSNYLDTGALPANDIGTLDEYDQCFVLARDIELNEVKLDIQFNAENVDANNNILIVKSGYTDVKTLIEHDAKVMSAQNAIIADLKQNGENAKITV